MHPLERWLAAVAVAHVAGGIALPLVLLQTAWLDPWLPVATPGARDALAVFGPTLASWGTLMFFLVQFGLREGRRWAADALVVAVLVWAPLDAALCWRLGWAAGLWLDGLVAPAILLPALVRRAQLARL